MKINTALILCAGYGKRLHPITLKTPKPLLKIKDISMLEQCINLIEKLGIQKIFINTFYLKDQFVEFLKIDTLSLCIQVHQFAGLFSGNSGSITIILFFV